MQPTHRTSKGRTRRRRAHHALSGVQSAACPNCGTAKQSHRACRECGYVRPGLKLSQNDGA